MSHESDPQATVQRSSDVRESTWAEAFLYLGPGVIALLVGAFGLKYGGGFIGLGYVGLILGSSLSVYGLYRGLQARKVGSSRMDCVYCGLSNYLAGPPDHDFRCEHCNRMIPIKDGRPLPVSQVRCGYCNHLNYYSEKTEVLLCENCNRDVPISLDDDRPRKQVARGYAVQDDDRLYELRLLSGGPKVEEVIPVLQRMLALNRKQVKQLLEDAPVTLLTGIPKMKAEMLVAQLTAHEAVAQSSPLDGSTLR
ncbi:MAG: hypothetical protein KIS66_05130 [Fimbriimonadaceae bacterium]|nr:hypothetical protein [Fimbriimonadaceae bacterium]